MTPPLGFERNDGQTAGEVRYFSRGPSSTLFLTGHKAILSFQGASLEMTPQGANPAPRIEAVDREPGAVNYLIGEDSSQWRRSVPRYERVWYRGVYQGIDLIYYGNGRTLEFDFVVAPGADPGSIRMAYGGADSLRVDGGGNLVIGVAGRQVIQHRPVVYQERNGRRETVDGHYVLDGRSVKFEVAKYDSARALVIDPSLSFSTYLGGSEDDQPTGITSDSSGNIYVTGWTDSPDFPTTAGAYIGTWPDRIAYVSKISPDGAKLVYSTFLGSSGSQTRSYAITVNSAGEAYVAGSAGTGFPTTAGAYGTAAQGTAYVAKLSADGSKLLMSTMIRGGNEEAYALAIDSTGSAYLTGWAGGQLVTTHGALQTTAPSGGGTGFIAKVAADGKSAGYVTYFDGNKGVDMYGIATDTSGNAYVTGTTRSTNLNTTTGAPQVSPPSAGLDNGFVFKLNPTGSGVVWGTYLGAQGTNFPSGLTIDSSGSVYVVGQSELSGGPFPTTIGAYKTTSCTDQCNQAWLVKYTPDGKVVFSTLLGNFNLIHGGAWGGGVGPAVDPNGNIYIIGDTWSGTDFVGTADAFKRTIDAGDYQQIVVARVDASGGGMSYATFYGGTGDEYARGIAVDSCGSIYVTGVTGSTDLTVTSGAVQGTPPGKSGQYNTFVAKFLQPFFTPSGVTNAGSYVAGKVAPGEIVSIFGCNIGPDTPTPYHLTNNKFDNSVSQTRVLFDGVPAPIIFAWTNQTSVVVPYSVAGKQTTQVVAEYRGIKGPAVGLPVANAIPGIFTLNTTGSGPAAVLNSDYTTNRAGNAAARGDYVMVFATIGGENGQDGAIAGNPLAHPLSDSASVTVGGVNAQVLYAGNAPGLIWGMAQINLVIPASVAPGNALPLVISIGGTTSQTNATIAVK
jgi:uncharacterized protein (TIGR03437 family)